MFIYWISGESGCLVSSTDASKAVGQKFVTHADYRALEDENRSLRASFDEAHQLWIKAAEELASIKARVGELVAADHEYDICSLEFRDAYNEGCEETDGLADEFSVASERRRLALETFK